MDEEMKMQVLVFHPDLIRTGRGHQALIRIIVLNDEGVTHHEARIYFNPVGPATETWLVERWQPRVLATDDPAGGLSFKLGDLAPGQSLTLSVNAAPPVITETKKYPIEVAFESSIKKRKTLYRGEITVTR
ncbi:MAG: hypothetical protein ACE5Z5_08355 [Candidatus Bathyarchaeia archaeon]